MLRYFVIAGIIVLTVAVVATAWVGRNLIRIKIASVEVRATPKSAPPNGRATPNGRPFIGDAPWALSALPECLIQRQASHGTLAYALAHLPTNAQIIRPPATLRFGDCTISLIHDEAYVKRGPDRFRIPPSARFYAVGTGLALLRVVGKTAELRIYQRSNLKL